MRPSVNAIKEGKDTYDLRLRVSASTRGRAGPGERLHGLESGGEAERLGPERGSVTLLVRLLVGLLRAVLVDGLLGGRRLRAKLRLGEGESVGEAGRIGTRARVSSQGARARSRDSDTYSESFESSSSSSSACFLAFLMTASSSTGVVGQSPNVSKRGGRQEAEAVLSAGGTHGHPRLVLHPAGHRNHCSSRRTSCRPKAGCTELHQ